MPHINIEQIKRKLELQKKESLQFLRRLSQETRSVDVDSSLDNADRCTADLEKESLFERSSQRRTHLRLVEAALSRIENGSFGVCVACGEEIQPRRLQAIPWTQFCLACQEELEQEVNANLSGRAFVSPGESSRRAG